MNVFTRRTAVGLAAAATLTLTACSSGTTTSSGSTSTPVTSTPGSTSTSGLMTSDGMMTSAMPGGAVSSAHNDTDATFAQLMIVHHQGAIEMADLVPTRAANQQVKDLAVKIKAAQGPEIEQMAGWLQAWGVGSGTDMNGMPNSTSSSAAEGEMGGMSGMGGSDTSTSPAATSAAMPGMMTADEMSQLTAATGAEFDKMFLQMMITHHQGAIEMADTEIAQGSNPDALTLAQSIKTSQTAEITTMQQLLQTL